MDLLFNNADVSLESVPVSESDPATWRRVIDINLTGVYHVARAFINDMPRGGIILNTGSGSGSGESKVPNHSSCNASKAGVHMFTGVLALEAWDRRICGNTLIPGPVATLIVDWSMDAQSEEEVLAAFKDKPRPQAPSEIVKPASEVAEFVHYLFSFPESGPTGQVCSIARRPF